MRYQITKGSERVTAYLYIKDASGPVTGLTFSSVTAYYVRPLGDSTEITLASQTVTGDYASGGFVEVDSTNMPGIYRFDIPDEVLASGADSAVIMLTEPTTLPAVMEIELTNIAGAVWDAPTAEHVEAGSFGGNLDGQVSTLATQITLDNLDAYATAYLAAIREQTDQLTFDDSKVVAAVDEQAIAEGIAAELGEITDPLLNNVPGSYASGTAGAALGRLTSGTTTIRAIPYQTANNLRIVRGDDYKAVDDRAIEFSNAQWPDLAGATVKFTARYGTDTLAKDGTVITATGTKVVRFELEAEDTNDLLITKYTFDVEATLSNGNIVTLIDSGEMRVIQDQTRPAPES